MSGTSVPRTANPHAISIGAVLQYASYKLPLCTAHDSAKIIAVVTQSTTNVATSGCQSLNSGNIATATPIKRVYTPATTTNARLCESS